MLSSLSPAEIQLHTAQLHTGSAPPPPLLVAAEVADFHNTEKKLVINGWTDYLYSAEYQQLLSQHALYCTVKTL